MDVYMDAEFDCVRKGGRCIQCMISIGMIAIEDECVVDSFYSLIQPKFFRTLTRTVKRITKLSDEEILQAPGFREVMNAANAFLEHLGKPYQFYTFGPDDVRTLKQQAMFEGYGKIKAFTDFIDLQNVISKQISYNEKLLSYTLSLDDLKYIFGINNKVEHNALNDAVDLYLIHDAHQRAAIQNDRLHIIYERKRQKQEDAKKRSLIHTQNLLFERYHFYEHQIGNCSLYPDVLNQLKNLAERGSIRLPFEVHVLLLNQSYEQGNLTMEWLMHPYPLVKLSIALQDEQWQQECPLTCGNAGAFEIIWQLCTKNKDCD